MAGSIVGDWWLPASSLKTIWDSAPDQIPFGETALRTVTIEAVGMTADQLPPLPFLPPGQADQLRKSMATFKAVAYQLFATRRAGVGKTN